ncbi:MAG: glycosyltransferase [Halofilum sp. (in: g-proteobacteria)]|nr:glycosyltransferase [Halofilum sp. (in: g-proteobacteria)]
MAYIKGGIGFADRVTTVSATYAREITHAQRSARASRACSRTRGSDLAGIANGIDTRSWDPAQRPGAAGALRRRRPAGKRDARAALLAETGLRAGARTPVVAYVGRLAAQKGVDVLLDALDGIVALPAAVVVLGAGDATLRAGLARHARARPDRVHVRFGFDEAFARRLYAGADMLVMPSRFEPCGLGQLNAMRYGTIPVVRRTGGLAETVVDTTPATLAEGTATGFHFDADTAAGLVAALRRARGYFVKPTQWRRLVDHAMRRDSSWARSARAYLDLYGAAVHDRGRALRINRPGTTRHLPP